MKNILLAVDFDGSAHKLLKYAADLAEKFQAKVWVLHIEAADPDFVGYEPGPQYIRDCKAEELTKDHKRLSSLAEQLRQEGIESEAIMVQGPTVKMILDEAQKLGIDLIISASHDHGFFYKAFRESTSSQLFKKSKIPLLTIPVES